VLKGLRSTDELINMNTKRKRKPFPNRHAGKLSQSAPRRNARKASTLDPNRLVQRAVESQVDEFKAAIPFSEMALHPTLKSNLKKKGFDYPTQIQEATFSLLNEGKNLVGIANTGTGKTGAFLIPIIEKLNYNSDSKALIMVPTRELALQVQKELDSLIPGLGIYSACFIGGTNIDRDIKKLRRSNDVIIGTPGRLKDLMQRGNLRLGNISTLVLDEFDRMLDMGFINDVEAIIRSIKKRDQTMLFSATIDSSQKKIIDRLVDNPHEIKVSNGKTTSENVDQEVIRVPAGTEKLDLLLDLLKDSDLEKVLLFMETKHQANKTSKKLTQKGINSDCIHGNKSQNYRVKALKKFKDGDIRVLVATDVAARGIDISDVSHVINFQLPYTYEEYIHRIGRTGRAGKAGKAFTFVDASHQKSTINN